MVGNPTRWFAVSWLMTLKALFRMGLILTGALYCLCVCDVCWSWIDRHTYHADTSSDLWSALLGHWTSSEGVVFRHCRRSACICGWASTYRVGDCRAFSKIWNSPPIDMLTFRSSARIVNIAGLILLPMVSAILFESSIGTGNTFWRAMRSLLLWCSSVCPSVWDGRALWSYGAL